MTAAKFPVCTVQSQVPRLSRQPNDMNNQAGDTGLIKMDMLKETFKTTMHG